MPRQHFAENYLVMVLTHCQIQYFKSVMLAERVSHTRIFRTLDRKISRRKAECTRRLIKDFLLRKELLWEKSQCQYPCRVLTRVYSQTLFYTFLL
jgi:hypothetical protein